MNRNRSMIHKLLFFVFVLFSVEFVFAIQPGDQLSDLVLESQSEKEVSLAQYHGKIIYLDIWASWCATCVESLTWMDQLQKKFGDEKFEVLTVNVDENRSDAEKVLEEAGVHLPVFYDPEGKIPERLQITGMPFSYLVDAEGKVISVHEGLREKDQHEIEKQLQQQLKTSSRQSTDSAVSVSFLQ